ncbi:MAG: PHP domain-containing protein [Paenibacillaceae bacterium]
MLMDLHTHSNYSDGKNTPEEMIEAAIEIGYDAIAITDHVWKTSLWIPAYVAHLETLKKKYENEIKLYTGIEAKVVSLEGDIDADPSFDAQVDLILGSIHRIPHREGYFSNADMERLPKPIIIENWLLAFYRMLENPRIDIIAHPLSELRAFGIRDEDLPIREISDRIAGSNKIMEFNVRYNTMDEQVIKQTRERSVQFLISSDSHSVKDLIVNSRKVKELTGRGFRIVDIHQYLLNKKKAEKH